MANLPAGPAVVHVGMDTSMREIVYGVLLPGRDVPVVERIPERRGRRPAHDGAAGRLLTAGAGPVAGGGGGPGPGPGLRRPAR